MRIKKGSSNTRWGPPPAPRDTDNGDDWSGGC